MSTSGSRSIRTLFLLVLSALAFGLIAPIAPASAATDFTTPPKVWIADMTPGLPYVGDELAAVLSPASDPAADSYAYQWYTVDADDNVVEIPGATGERYTVAGSDADMWLQVRVTASKAGYNDASHMSEPTDNRITRLEFTSPPVVTIDDTTPAVGQTLMASATDSSPKADSYTYQWTRGGDNEIAGAVGSTFTPTSAEVGEQLEVKVTAIKDGYRSAEVRSGETAEVEGNRFSSPLGVTIDDMTPAMGQTLTATASGEFPPGTEFTYMWCLGGYPITRGGTNDSTPSETNPTYVVTGDDVDLTLTVRVTARKYGYHSLKVTSAATAVVQGEHFTSPPVVTIDDLTPTEGQTLTATVSGESPTAERYRQQWYRDGSPILDETQLTHRVTSEDVGHTLTFMAKARSYGYNDSAEVTVTTAVVEPAPPQNFTMAPTANLSTTAPRVGTVLKVTPTGELPEADSYTYQWYRVNDAGTATAITGATAATYAVVDADLTRRLRVKVYAVRAGYTSKSTLSIMTARVNKITVSKSPIPHGHTLTVTAQKLRAGQTYRIYIGTTRVYTGTVGSTGTVSRIVRVPSATGAQRVRVSGYNKAGARDFTVFTTITVT